MAVRVPVLTVKTAVRALANTVTEAGTVRAGEAVFASATTVLAEEALDSVTVHVVLALDARLEAVHCNAETVTGATREIVAGLEEPFREAVIVAV